MLASVNKPAQNFCLKYEIHFSEIEKVYTPATEIIFCKDFFRVRCEREKWKKASNETERIPEQKGFSDAAVIHWGNLYYFFSVLELNKATY